MFPQVHIILRFLEYKIGMCVCVCVCIYIYTYIYIYTHTHTHTHTHIFGPGSSVGIATDYGLDGPEIESRWGEIFRPSRAVLRPTQPPVQWVPSLTRGKVRSGRAADHSPPSSAVVMEE